jgi:S-adenosylmethionine decarboxylase
MRLEISIDCAPDSPSVNNLIAYWASGVGRPQIDRWADPAPDSCRGAAAAPRGGRRTHRQTRKQAGQAPVPFEKRIVTSEILRAETRRRVNAICSGGFNHPPDWPIMRAVSPGSGLEEFTVVKPIPRLRLQGFNNLTKALSFNIYDICYAVSEDQRQRYIEYIDEAYNAERLTTILTDVADIIGANILNVARQDYDPQGASVTILISEEPVVERLGRDTISGAVVAHLDKSHITVHTYPETHPHNGIATFRADIDVATCGVISPLKALNFLIDSFESDIVIADYRVRGFTRDVKGRKHYMDHRINSVQEYLAKHIRQKYEMFDVNVYQENMFHTKMHIKDFDLDTYLFEAHSDDLSFKERQRIGALLRREIEELFHGRNLT